MKDKYKYIKISNMSKIERYYNIAKKSRTPVIIADIEGERDMVLLPLNEYERLLDDDFCDEDEWVNPMHDICKSENVWFGSDFKNDDGNEKDEEYCFDVPFEDTFIPDPIEPLYEQKEEHAFEDVEDIPFEDMLEDDIPDTVVSENSILDSDIDKENLVEEKAEEDTSVTRIVENDIPTDKVGKWASVGSVFSETTFEPGKALNEKTRKY